MKSVRSSIASVIKGRSLSGQAAVRKTELRQRISPQDVKITKLPSGVSVVSLENYSPISRVAVTYNVGSRHESAEEIGFTHCIRVASNHSTQKATNFSIAKNVQQIGASLSCSTTREQTMYTVQCLRSHLDVGVEALNHVSTGLLFREWDLDDSNKNLRQDLEIYKHSPEAQLMEAVHKAAFRDTLGRSLYMDSDRIGKYRPNSVTGFVRLHYVSNSASVAGIGVDHETLVQLARKMTIEPGHAPEHKKAKYHGGELRLEKMTPLVHAAIVTEGVAVDSPDVIAMGILQLVLGSGPLVKYSTNLASSKIAKAAASATTYPFAASAICASYSDSGLFGFQVSTSAEDAGKVLKSIINTMAQATKNTITDADLQRAKRQFKASFRMEAESAAERLDWLGAEVLLSGQSVDLQQLDSEVDKVTLEDVNRVAKKFLNGKPTMAAVGDLSNTPYLDELL